MCLLVCFWQLLYIARGRQDKLLKHKVLVHLTPPCHLQHVWTSLSQSPELQLHSQGIFEFSLSAGFRCLLLDEWCCGCALSSLLPAVRTLLLGTPAAHAEDVCVGSNDFQVSFGSWLCFLLPSVSMGWAVLPALWRKIWIRVMYLAFAVGYACTCGWSLLFCWGKLSPVMQLSRQEKCFHCYFSCYVSEYQPMWQSSLDFSLV